MEIGTIAQIFLISHALPGHMYCMCIKATPEWTQLLKALALVNVASDTECISISEAFVSLTVD